MKFEYQIYGIPIFSEFELPSLVGISDIDLKNPIKVSKGKVPVKLTEEPNETKPLSTFNENEFLFYLPNLAKYYICNGNNIIIEPIGSNWEEILLHLYSNGLTAALLQRNIISLHVSGIFVSENKVLLFAAPSRTGKSTTAIMLQQKGYAPFTDDTAKLNIIDGKCYAQASYPMTRLWQNTIEKQHQYTEENKQIIFEELDKFGFSFHDKFNPGLVEVAGIVFLEESGLEIKIDKMNYLKSIQYFSNNIYRKQWIVGMKKQKIQFDLLTKIVNTVPSFLAQRPKYKDTFNEFSDAIETQIINILGN